MRLDRVPFSYAVLNPLTARVGHTVLTFIFSSYIDIVYRSRRSPTLTIEGWTQLAPSPPPPHFSVKKIICNFCRQNKMLCTAFYARMEEVTLLFMPKSGRKNIVLFSLPRPPPVRISMPRGFCPRSRQASCEQLCDGSSQGLIQLISLS